MAGDKISALPAQTTLTTDDIFPVVDIGAIETRKITVENAARDLVKFGISVGNSAPTSPYTGQPWVDTTTATPLLKFYTGSTWTVSSVQPTSVVTSPGTTAPSTPTTGVLWLDTSTTPVQLKAWDGSNWTQIDPDAVNRTASTGSAILPTGTTAQRDGSPAAGYLRFNSTLSRFEGYNGSAWGAVLVEDSSGNVGIGTSSPSAPLTIQAASSGWAEKILGRSSGNYSEIGFYNNDGTTFRSGIYSSDNNGLRFRALGQFIVAVGAAGSQDTERLRIDSSGRLLIGTSTSIDGYQLQIADTTGSNLSVFSFSSTSAYGPDITLNHSLGGTVGTQAAVVSGSHLGRIVFRGSDGSGFKNAAAIETFVDGTPGTNDMPGRLVFSTTTDGASTPTERMRITNAGHTQPGADNAYTLGVSGTRWSAVWAANGTIQTSDERQKIDISTSTLGLDFIKSLRPVSYKWKVGRNEVSTDEDGETILTPVPGSRTHWGFLAQEVKATADAAGVDFGGWIQSDPEDPESEQGLRYDQFIAPVVKALQEAMERIESLEAEVAALKAA